MYTVIDRVQIYILGLGLMEMWENQGSHHLDRSEDQGFAPPSRVHLRKEKAKSPNPGAVFSLSHDRGSHAERQERLPRY